MEDGKKIVVKQIRSGAGRTKRVKATLEALGLGRIGKESVKTVNPAVKGMIRKVRYLLSVTEAA